MCANSDSAARATDCRASFSSVGLLLASCASLCVNPCSSASKFGCSFSMAVIADGLVLGDNELSSKFAFVPVVVSGRAKVFACSILISSSNSLLTRSICFAKLSRRVSAEGRYVSSVSFCR